MPDAYCVEGPPLAEEACEVPCSADCVVGPWSSWSTCSHSCASKTAEGRQSRTRTVLAIPQKGNPKFPLISLTLSHLILIKNFFALFTGVIFNLVLLLMKLDF